MTGSLTFALTFLAAIGGGIMPGLFFVFSNFAMTAAAGEHASNRTRTKERQHSDQASDYSEKRGPLSSPVL